MYCLHLPPIQALLVPSGLFRPGICGRRSLMPPANNKSLAVHVYSVDVEAARMVPDLSASALLTRLHCYILKLNLFLFFLILFCLPCSLLVVTLTLPHIHRAFLVFILLFLLYTLPVHSLRLLLTSFFHRFSAAAEANLSACAAATQYIPVSRSFSSLFGTSGEYAAVVQRRSHLRISWSSHGNFTSWARKTCCLMLLNSTKSAKSLCSTNVCRLIWCLQWGRHGLRRCSFWRFKLTESKGTYGTGRLQVPVPDVLMINPVLLQGTVSVCFFV